MKKFFIYVVVVVFLLSPIIVFAGNGDFQIAGPVSDKNELETTVSAGFGDLASTLLEPVEDEKFHRFDVYLGYYNTLDSDESASGGTCWTLARIWFNRYRRGLLIIDPGLYVYGAIGDGDYNYDGYVTDYETSTLGFGVSVNVARLGKFEITADLGYQFQNKDTDKTKRFGTFTSEQEDDMVRIYVNYSDFRRRVNGERLFPKTSVDLTVEQSFSDRYTGKWNGVKIAGLDSYDPGKTQLLVRQYIWDFWVATNHRLSPGVNVGYDIYAESDRDDSAILGICLGWGWKGQEILRLDYNKKTGDDAKSIAIIGSFAF